MKYIIPVLYLLFSSFMSGNSFESSLHFPKATIASAPNLFKLMDDYVLHHSKEAILNDTNICNRRFIVATYAGPQAIGNHMHEFINAFGGAFITNRTLIWRFCNRKPCQLDSERDFDEFLTRLPWIASHSIADKKWKEQKCEGSTNEYHLIPQKFRWQSNKIFMCCGIDKLPFSFLDYGTHELHEIHSLTLKETRLEKVYRDRANELFQFGEDFGYGVLLRSSFEFKDYVVTKNNRAIESFITNYNKNKFSSTNTKHLTMQNSVVIGVHLRHSAMDDVDGADHGETVCLKQLVSRYINNSVNCVIFLASDRQKKIESWQNRTMRELNCSLVISNHTYTAYVNRPEHGPYTGEIAVQDIEIISRSDIFLGSSYTSQHLRGSTSSYSLLIAALRATNGGKFAISDKSYWLPTCGHALGNKYEPDGPYTDTKFRCGNCVPNKIMLPEWCPYWNKTDLEQQCTGGPLCNPFHTYNISS